MPYDLRRNDRLALLEAMILPARNPANPAPATGPGAVAAGRVDGRIESAVDPLAALLRDSLAYATYRDTQYTAAAPLALLGGARTRLTNTGTVLQSTRPSAELEWLRGGKLYPGHVGDTYQIRINCSIEATSPLALELENELIFPAITGAGAAPLEIISTSGRTVGTRLGGLAKKMSFYHTVYCGQRFFDGGCEVYLTANALQGALPAGLGMRVYDISFALFRFRQGPS